MSLQITIKDRSDKELATFSIDESSNVSLLKRQLSQILKKNPLRIHLSYKSTVLDDNDRILKTYNLEKSSVLIYKDLGPQIRWKTVFFVEYLGPMIIYGALYFFAKLSGKLVNPSLQSLIAVMGCLHFLKRVLETAFVHVFSRDSMPKKRLLINCLHYWLLFGINVGIESFFFWKDPQYSEIRKLILVAGN
jgi:very-long-chain enoyl-CoA reductase